jgi:hypothetical protein
MQIVKAGAEKFVARYFAACCLVALVSVAAFWPAALAVAEEKSYQVDLANCAGFTAKDAAPLLGVPEAKVARSAQKVHAALWTCSFSGGQPTKMLTFSVEVAKSAKAAAADIEQYRNNLEITAETAPFKNKLPKGAWSEISGDGLGDETVWTDVNGTFTARKGNITIQVSMPGDKVGKINVGRAVLSKF